jgi:microcystin-dependent protein
MSDFSLPVLSSLYTDVLNLLKERDVDAGTLCKDAPTNQPVGMFKYDRATNKFQEWNGSTWEDKVLDVAGGGTGGATASAARTSLGLGSIATQNSNNVTVTGGNISGVNLNASDVTSGVLALARGGTGASLSLGASGTVLRSIGGAVAFSTDGSALTALNASNLASGTVSASRLPDIEWDKITKASEGKRGAVSMFTNDAGYVTSATAGMPIGAIIDYGGVADISPWFVCNGRSLNRITYAALYSVIGLRFTTGDDGVNFNIPNFTDRSSVGFGTYSVGQSIGALAHNHAPGTLANAPHVGHVHPISGTSGSPTAGHIHTSLTGSSEPTGNHNHDVRGTTQNQNADHGHSISSGYSSIGIVTERIYHGDGPAWTDAVVGITDSKHNHTGSTGIQSANHQHSMDFSTNYPGNHSHTGGTYATNSESVHTHTGGSLQADSGGNHGHTISGYTAEATHACVVVTKLIKYA